MNHNQDYAFNSLKIISKSESYDNNSGSIIVNGGIGCKKTIHCENLCAKNSFFNNITISGAINNINFDNQSGDILVFANSVLLKVLIAHKPLI